MPGIYLPVTWNHYHKLTQKLAAAVLDTQEPFDEIVAIARGGLTLGHLLSDYLRIPISSITIQSYTDIQQQGEVQITAGLAREIAGKRILLVDDIADSGKTLVRAVRYLEEFKPKAIKTLTMFYKPHCKVVPDFYAQQSDKWILLPFEVTEWICTFSQKLGAEGKTKAQIQVFLERLGYTPDQIKFARRHHLSSSNDKTHKF
jgi:hypoxanthine phosphoribosyltransferase